MDRWNQSEVVVRAAARCADVPRTIGDWEGADQQLDSRQIALAKIYGYVMRRYVHRKSSDAVTVMLVCGRPGPIAVHTPDICFQGGGFAMKAVPQGFRLDVPARRAKRSLRPRDLKRTASASWSAGRGRQTVPGRAPDKPRIQVLASSGTL